MLLNGLPADQIPLSDRGLQYGDGLFETLAVVDGIPRFWDRHMNRLARGETALGFPIIDKALLRREADEVCRSKTRGVLKIVLTRGSGGRGYRPPEPCEPRRILSLHDWPDYPERWYRDGIALRVCHMHLGRNRRLAGIKHLNRLEQVLARREWDDPEIAEGLMLDGRGNVISGTQSNLFLIDNGALSTPDLTYSGIAGIMREVIIGCAERLGLTVRIEAIDLERVKAAEALFVTNSLLGLCPVVSMDSHAYDIERISPSLRQVVAEAVEAGV
ncbi:MAG: aminodeoxychorismate lyase [Candidatus Thiodiazotropha sp.]